MRLPVVREGADNASDDEVAGSHTNSAGKQDLLSTEAINPEHGRDGEDKFQDANNTSSQQRGGVAAQFESLKDERTVIVRYNRAGRGYLV